jgi:TolA-binding protein
LAAAQKMIADGKYEEAIRMLTPIAREYTGLDWDIVAQLQIARALVGKKDFTGAIARYEDLFTKMPEVKKQSDALWSYHGALQEAKQYDKLKAALKQALAEGSHADVLRAQMMRGDLEAEQGNLENALLDYLRTVTFAKTGKEAPPKEVVPQAMLKTAQTLEKMKDGRAKEWYRKVVQDYPQSPEAAVAKKKI